MKEITVKEIQRLFIYRNGELIRRIDIGQCFFRGSVAGSICKRSGYKSIQIYGKSYKVHRLIFLLKKGYLPENVDHINGNKLDNRIENLREANKYENNRNSKLRKDNISGYKGVSFCPLTKKWRSRIVVFKKEILLGKYDLKEDAAIAYNKAATLYFKDFALLNDINTIMDENK